MIISPDRRRFVTIFHLLGKFVLGISLFFLIPLFVGIIYGETSAVYDFAIALCVGISLGLLLLIFFPVYRDIGVFESFSVASLIWLVASLLGALPLYLSGHWGSFLDAWFEAMSGFATTGLILVQDLDHLSMAHNMWRHLMMFIGGQGIIIAGISLLGTSSSAMITFYIGEGRQERIFPNIIDTARFIWKVSFIYLGLGVIALGAILFSLGMRWDRAFFHGLWLFMAAFDTGGFAPQTQNITYYHSFLLEVITMICMILGAINFNLHFWLWQRSKKELFKNFEVRTFFFTTILLSSLLFISLKGTGVFFRQAFYQIISAHTGCGFTNLTNWELNGWGLFSIFILTIAMGLGGGVCSTTGGIKLLRIGIILKSIGFEIKRWMYPLRAMYRNTYHHLKDRVVNEREINEAYTVFFVYFLTYILGGIIIMLFGYNPVLGLFEAVSATANVGLSVGITQPSMPWVIKILFIFLMWLGRLEFFSIFIPISFLLSKFKK